MFIDFLFCLRRRGVPVGTQEWLALHDALQQGLIQDIDSLYGLGRALLVHTESWYDEYDLAFLEVFKGVDDLEVRAAIEKWLENPVPFRGDPADFEKWTGMSLEELLERFEQTLKEQKERHDGGNRWVGTGGTSPWGRGGQNPNGIRVGEGGGGRSAVQVAAERRFRDFRSDVTIDVRQFKIALRALRHLGKAGREELSVDPTIRRTCDDGGEIHLVYEKERKNTVRLVLLMDAGGSMAPYARLVDRLFSAASELGHWKSMDHYFFHNTVYSRVWTSFERRQSIPTEELLQKHPERCKVVFVGDACMAPWELTAVGGSLSLWDRNARNSLDWLKQLRAHWPDAIWLNPEPQRYWNHETITTIGQVFPMFPLTLDGLREGVARLKKGDKARARSA